MRTLLIIAMLVTISGYGRADDRLTGETVGLKIRTVDENNHAFRVEVVRWWYSGNRDVRYELKCETDLCAKWVIKEEISGSIVVHADTSIVKENDEYCWDLFAGEVVVEMPTREVMIVMRYVSTACKSHQTIQQ